MTSYKLFSKVSLIIGVITASTLLRDRILKTPQDNDIQVALAVVTVIAVFISIILSHLDNKTKNK